MFHNSRRLDDGRWTWRYDTMRTVPDFAGLWAAVDAMSAPVTLVRGSASGCVADEDADELARRTTHFHGMRVVQNSGHSV